MKSKKQNGITLVALVITIVAMLILAGITINLTIGQDGIITKAQEAGKNYVEAANYENQMLKDFESMTDDILTNVTGGNGGGGSPVTPPANPTLVSSITEADYGKTINYSANGVTDWKVFYNDGSNVYIIASDYIPNTLAPAVLDKSTTNTYNVYSNTDRDTLLNALTTQSNWSAFVDSSKAQSATGAPTGEMLMNSYNAKHNTSLAYTDGPTLDTTDSLYVTSQHDGCDGYWLASPVAGDEYRVWRVGFNGNVYNYRFSSDYFGVRPVVCLQSGITGTVGDTNVTI